MRCRNPSHTPVQSRVATLLLAASIAMACGACARHRQAGYSPPGLLTKERVLADHENFYSRPSLGLLAGGFAAGAVAANTPADEDFRGWYQEQVHSETSESLAETVKILGEGVYILPALGVALAVGELGEAQPACSVTGDWADRSLRALLVGAPSLLLAQSATGASRPGETRHDSVWRPFADDNGVSGHAFVGAVPLITAGKMVDEPWAKAGFYAASAAAAWSRIDKDAHYASQSFLGWWVAYLACDAVNSTERVRRDWELTTLPVPGGAGVGVVFQR